MKSLRPELERRQQAHLYRTPRTLSGPQGAERQMNGKPLLTFCSNDYLGLANHPDVVAAFKRGADQYGVGSGAAHLVTGHTWAHQALEEALAEFTGRPRALLFSTGYMANLGVMTTLLGRGDTVFQDRLNHASLLDGSQLSRARLKRFPHQDMVTLADQLQTAGAGEKLVAIDGVFSMDGDLAPLAEMAALCQKHDAWLMVDDAHGLGVLGESGAGTLEYLGLDIEAVPILMGTLGKGLGTFGAFVAGSEDLIETLIQQARSYIFTTAIPPAVAEATLASLERVQADSWRRDKLRTLIERFRQGAGQLGLPLMKSETPIQPVVATSSEQALAWSQTLEDQGILVSAIRPPTVPEGSARLRVTLSASHTEEHVDRLLSALETLR
ncbi:MAG: 8-amino-7-oxononanoate synthase [Gammaproteobacteria bacterium]|nr:8-amino-7-oxononanoate synthase [Gammaproteobacteria bacterium]